MSARKAVIYRRAAEYSLLGARGRCRPLGGCMSIELAGGSYKDRSFKYWFGEGKFGYWWNDHSLGAPSGEEQNARVIALLLMAHIAEDSQ